jgi:hypothetical protein
MSISISFKEYINNMSNDLSKKELEAYIKDAMKKALEVNTVNKTKKEPNDYQKFMKEKIKILKKDDPNLTGPQVFSMVAAMWRTQKEDVGGKEKVDVNDEVKEDVKDEVNDEVKEDVKDEVKEEVKDEVKEVVKEKKKKQK